MSLKDLRIQDEYRSSECNIVKDFYIPCLEQATGYSRAVGYFSSSSMACVAQGLTAFIRSGGRMRLITSPQLSEEDVQAIEQGLQQREQVVAAALRRELEAELPQVIQDRLAALAWLLGQGLLEIKLAVPRTLRRRGIYHEKLGVFTDADGHVVAFTGSANESASALIDNFECLDVFTSWDEGVRRRALQKAQNFEALWNNQTKNVEVMAFPDAVARSLLQFCPPQAPTQEPRVSAMDEHYNPDSLTPEISKQGVPITPFWLTLRPYQQQAIENWFKNKGRGTLKMATGSGKTITALAVAAELYQKIELKALIVVCPYRHLVQQWDRECRKFGLKPILAYESVKKWQDDLSHQLVNLNLGLQPFLTVITTNATLMSQGLQTQLGSFPKKTLLIGDEAHNLGAARLMFSLPEKIRLRLGLSATPERYFDDQGTQALFDYFGPVLEPEFTLKDAIAVGALVHYRYYPILVELTEDESLRYAELSAKIGKALAIGGDGDDNEALGPLLAQRARLVGAAENKLMALKDLMSKRIDTSHTLFYCGDGSVEDSVTQESKRQLEAVTKLLGYELGYRVNTYTAETSLDEREDLRQQFESGDLQGLVAIRCLDEGVDIPAIQTAVILASSSNPRQFVQRRGRILRCYPNKRQAELFDMIVIPPDLDKDSLVVERSLLRKELKRFVEFASLSDNEVYARTTLLPIQRKYDLMDL